MMQRFFLYSSGEHVNEILILGTESGLDGLMKYKDQERDGTFNSNPDNILPFTYVTQIDEKEQHFLSVLIMRKSEGTYSRFLYHKY